MSPSATPALPLAEALGRRVEVASAMAAAIRAGDGERVRKLIGEMEEASARVAQASAGFAMAGLPQDAQLLLAQIVTRSKAADEGVAAALREAGADGIVAWIATHPADPPRGEPDPRALELHAQAQAASNGGEWGRAVALWRATVALPGAPAQAWLELGTVLHERGGLAEAIACLQRAVALAPGEIAALNELANALANGGLTAMAIDLYRRALEIRPDTWEVLVNLGAACEKAGRVQEAVAAWEKAVAVRPEGAEAWSNLGGILKELGELDRAVACCRRAVEAAPSLAAAHSNLLFVLHYGAGDDGKLLFDEHRRFAEVHARPLEAAIRPHGNDRAPERRLRVGYVSPDFRAHAVADFFGSLLEGHDRSAVEAICYSDVLSPDATTRALREKADGWRDIGTLDDASAAELVRRDGIDVLVDLAGHTARNRMLLFARKPAPVAFSWLGYPDTTGLRTIDWRITDALADPPGIADGFHSERLARLPRPFLCWRPMANAPAVAPLPALASGFLTFGSFNTFAKVSPRALDLFAAVLQAVPGSRLLLKAAAMADEYGRRKVLEHFARKGIGPERLELMARTRDVAGHLAVYGRVDVALDTFPYQGTTTTCEALWMGVPVLSRVGSTHVSRVGASLLGAIGAGEWTSETDEGFAAAAVSLAADLPALSRIRAGLRDRMKASALMDGAGLARAIEHAYREAWKVWCARG